MSTASKIMKPSASNTPPADTPPSSPTLSSSQPIITMEVAQQLINKLQALVASKTMSDGSSEPQITKGPVPEDTKTEEARSQASRLEYKIVNEVWDKKAYCYTVAEPVTSMTDVDELDQYVFIVRVRTDKNTQVPTSYIDIKSKELQNILVTVLQDVRGICLLGDKPSVETNLLFNFFGELRSCRDNTRDTITSEHLCLLLDFIETTYAPTAERFCSLLQSHEITYDLLWALFKPNAEVYTTCPGTDEPRCVKFNHGDEKRHPNGDNYFSLECRYFDFDGKVFGEASIELVIEKFRGTKRIDLLEVFPLQYHQNSAEIRDRLVDCGRKFVSLVGTLQHKRYEGTAFYKDEKGKTCMVSVKSRIMVDAAYFHQINPNYARPRVDESSKQTWEDMFIVIDSSSSEEKGQIKSAGVDAHELEDAELLLCSPTVLGFSLDDKLWLEFAVANISNIEWNPSSFDHLTIPTKQKKVIQALSQSYLTRDSECAFDDFVLGKGRGLVILLHGPPGVGKTLTAEAMSEYLRRPLYVISAGELGTTAEALEMRLSKIFRIASHWKAALLLDEADVFVEQRATSDIHRNALVCVFLRKLEYYEGILFLTTNRVKTIDEAIASRIHLALRYNPLDQNARMTVWKSFLAKASTRKGAADYGLRDLEHLARKDLNGREIKNLVSTAQALAAHDDTRMCLSHLEDAIALNKEFQSDFKGAGQIENLQSYL